jgi:predicted amidohydrolase YtcJ
VAQKTIYHNGKIATNAIPYFAEAIAVANGKVVATGTSSDLLRTSNAAYAARGPGWPYGNSRPQ